MLLNPTFIFMTDTNLLRKSKIFKKKRNKQRNQICPEITIAINS